MANPLGAIADLFSGLIGGGTADITTGITGVQGWLSSAAGQLASAIESGFLAVIKDLWDVVIGPIEVFIGAMIILFALIFLFKNDLMQAGAMIGLMAL